MTVYVDDVRHDFGRMVMCHMWADTDEELLAMADRIGVARKWIQGHPVLSHGKHRSASWVHFDISLGCKAKAIASGAVLTDQFGPLIHKHTMRAAEALDRGDVECAAQAVAMIEMAESSRAMRGAA